MYPLPCTVVGSWQIMALYVPYPCIVEYLHLGNEPPNTH
jgi:hypothetical protein